MFKLKYLWVPVCCALALSAPLRAQDDAVAMMERMRDSLRTTTLQLRSAQNDLAATRVQNESLVAENQRLKASLEQLTRQSTAEKTAAQANIENLNNQLSERNAQVQRMAAALKQWKDAYDKAAQIARGKESERATLATQLRVAERDIGNLRSRNMELYQIGVEILERYEDFGLGRAIKAREPFTGLARVQLQTLVQDYRDSMADARVTFARDVSATEQTEKQ